VRVVSMQRIAAVTAAVAVLMVAIWYMALIRPQGQHLKSAKADYATAEQQITKLDSQIVTLEAYAKQRPADLAKLASLNGQIPTAPDVSGIAVQLHLLASASGVQLTMLSPTSPYGSTPAPASGGQTSSPIRSIALSMTATGSYPQMSAFLSGLEHLPRDVVVDSVNIGSGSTGGLNANLTARTFFAP
jgi:Tfp pilus assembly protein PilO